MAEIQKTPCESCGMPIESGPHCSYCVDESGKLQPFDERFERMIQWTRRESPDISADDAEARTLAYMAKMPAWRDHPRVVAASSGE